MNYEMFVKMARLNSQFEVIPSNTSLFAEGVIIDNNGSIQHKGKTYITNMVNLGDMPEKLQLLFVEPKNQLLPSPDTKGNITTGDDKQKNDLGSLSKMLFDQLQNIVEPKAGTDIQHELKKANTVCNIADKLIGIADLSLKAEIFWDKKKERY